MVAHPLSGPWDDYAAPTATVAPPQAVAPSVDASAQPSGTIRDHIQSLLDSGATQAQIEQYATDQGVDPARMSGLSDAVKFRDDPAHANLPRSQVFNTASTGEKQPAPWEQFGNDATAIPDAPSIAPKPNTLSGLHPDEINAMFSKLPESMRPGLRDSATHGIMMGTETDAAGVTDALGNAIAHPVDAVNSGGQSVVDAYHAGRTHALAGVDYARMQNPTLAPMAEIGGALINPLGAEVKSLKTGAAVGAGFGGVSGFEDNNGSVGDRLLSGAKGAAVGGVVAGAVGGALKAGGAAVDARQSVMEGSPGLARRIVSKAIKADENTPTSAAQDILDAQANGVPYMLADTGDNARGLLAASVRTPGPARTIARDALDERQAGLADRVHGAIERDLGPIANPHQVADHLMTQAKATADPLYASAYAKPGAETFGQRIAPLMERPSMKGAMKRAYRIAAEEGRDPTTLGFNLNSSGEVSLSKVPSWQTLDYVKRGLDDVVESYRDPTSGRLNLDTEGRASNNTLRGYRMAFDKANPDYAAARAAYGGPVSGIDAMNAGRKSLTMTADDLEARLRDMTPFNKQMYALGARRAMAEAVASKGDTANVINTLIGTGKKRAMLARLFGDRKQFSRFVDTLMQEKQAFHTYARGTQGSQTALNLQDDATIQLGTAAVEAAASGGLPIGAAIRQAVKFGAGHFGEKTRQQVSALLSETSPARFQEIAAKLQAEAVRRGLINAHVGRTALGAGKVASKAVEQASQ